MVQGIMYLAAPLGFAVFQRWPHICRKSSPLGLAIVVVAIALSSFATSVWHLILTQGVLYALGGGLLYYPVFLFIDEWFVQRKGFAYGVMWAGTGCGGLSGPLVINWGLSRYGHQKFLRGWAVALVSHVWLNKTMGQTDIQAAGFDRTIPLLCQTSSTYLSGAAGSSCQFQGWIWIY